MRIAYIAPYQGPSLVRRRPSLGNLSLGGKVKVELIAELLQKAAHQIEVISQGEVIERRLKLYPAFSETELFHPDVPIRYASALPVRFFNALWSSLSTLRLFKAQHRISPFDLVIIYNLKPPQVASATYALQRLGLPVVLEYEDDQFLEHSESGNGSFSSRYYLSRAKWLLGALSGCLSGSPCLLSQVERDVSKLLLCGVVSDAILRANEETRGARHNRVLFSGTHSWAQGLEHLIVAWRTARPPGWELHIAGHGQLTETLHKLAGNDPSIVFHGLLSREENALFLASGRIAVVPYDVSQTRGFSFKTIECLAAELHVITTPLTALAGLPPELRAGLTYIEDNRPETIAACLNKVITERSYERIAAEATLREYGPDAVAKSLEHFLKQVLERGGDRSSRQPPGSRALSPG